MDQQKVGHRLIRRVSLDQFYALVTGQEDAFYQLCIVLPKVIQEVVDTMGDAMVPRDTVIEELNAIAAQQGAEPGDMSTAMAVYILGFGGYSGF